MENIHTILSKYGLSIPEDKRAEFDKAVAENYKTSAEHEKKVNRLTDDLAAEKKRADTAEETLKGFEGKDFDAITRDRDEWKRRHEEQAAAFEKAKEDRAFNDLLSSAISEAKGKNDKAIMALLDLEKLRASRNQREDIKADLDALRKENGYLFEDNGGAGKFTTASGSGSTGGGKKLSDMSLDERIKLKATNPEYYKSLRNGE